jgi:hypothetical protein
VPISDNPELEGIRLSAMLELSKYISEISDPGYLRAVTTYPYDYRIDPVDACSITECRLK